MNSELLEFTRRALEKGARREEIGAVLSQAGWSEADVRSAMRAFAQVDFPVPVPRPRPYLSAQEFFTYALFFLAVYISAFNLNAIVFLFIDLAFPAVANPSSEVAQIGHDVIFNQMRGNIAALVVAFPLFLLMHRRIQRGIAGEPTKRESWPRKWMTYLTLFVAASAILGDLMALVYNALEGEITLRLSLQLSSIAVIAGGAFGYFFWGIRRGEDA